AFHRSADFRSGCLRAVNLGDDADTTGAVYGQLAGAFYGASGIPGERVERLALRARIEELARGLFQLDGIARAACRDGPPPARSSGLPSGRNDGRPGHRRRASPYQAPAWLGSVDDRRSVSESCASPVSDTASDFLIASRGRDPSRLAAAAGELRTERPSGRPALIVRGPGHLGAEINARSPSGKGAHRHGHLHDL